MGPTAALGYAVLVVAGIVIVSYINITWLLQREIARNLIPPPENGTEYDFIVVGSGSAGSVVAARLAEDGRHRVLLVEAGGPAHWLQGIAAFAPYFMVGPYDWGYRAKPRPGKHATVERPWYPRGKVLGGTSMLNWMIYMRGHSGDYDEWEKLGNPGWSYEVCSYLQSENVSVLIKL